MFGSLMWPSLSIQNFLPFQAFMELWVLPKISPNRDRILTWRKITSWHTDSSQVTCEIGSCLELKGCNQQEAQVPNPLFHAH